MFGLMTYNPPNDYGGGGGSAGGSQGGGGGLGPRYGTGYYTLFGDLVPGPPPFEDTAYLLDRYNQRRAAGGLPPVTLTGPYGSMDLNDVTGTRNVIIPGGGGNTPVQLTGSTVPGVGEAVGLGGSFPTADLVPLLVIGVAALLLLKR